MIFRKVEEHWKPKIQDSVTSYFPEHSIKAQNLTWVFRRVECFCRNKRYFCDELCVLFCWKSCSGSHFIFIHPTYHEFNNLMARLILRRIAVQLDMARNYNQCFLNHVLSEKNRVGGFNQAVKVRISQGRNDSLLVSFCVGMQVSFLCVMYFVLTPWAVAVFLMTFYCSAWWWRCFRVKHHVLAGLDRLLDNVCLDYKKYVHNCCTWWSSCWKNFLPNQFITSWTGI